MKHAMSCNVLPTQSVMPKLSNVNVKLDLFLLIMSASQFVRTVPARLTNFVTTFQDCVNAQRDTNLKLGFPRFILFDLMKNLKKC